MIVYHIMILLPRLFLLTMLQWQVSSQMQMKLNIVSKSMIVSDDCNLLLNPRKYLVILIDFRETKTPIVPITIKGRA